ncbi:hypothetical protein KY385_04685 [Candidatus Parcubacteria bacterium]|nr:hypothetical protein [Candidatus Parcubacteria bacterium]
MAKNEAIFCDECPMRGRCKTEVIGFKERTIQGSGSGRGAFIIRLGVLVDTLMRPSEVVKIPVSYTPDEAVEAVRECEYPNYTEEGRFFKRQQPHCRAIGDLACQDRQLADIANQVL